MSSEKFLAIVIVVCSASAVLAKPNAMLFDIAKQHTVCRTRVVYDTNEDRIPKIIKTLKCEEDPYVMCPAIDGTSTPCCGSPGHTGAAKFSCTEVLDNVLVKNAKTMTEYIIKVPIGCSCIKHDPNKAKE